MSTELNSYFTERADGMLSELLKFVRIESPSHDAIAIRRFARELEVGFSAAGALVEIHDDHPNGPNVVARYGSGGSPTLLVGHMDTVWPLGTLKRMPAEVRGGLAFGPGIFDMKAGCLMALETVRALSSAGSAIPVTVLLTCDEEVGSESSRPIIAAEAAKSREALVLEPAIPGGLAKTSRSGAANYRITAKGRAAHAGVDPDKGVSAIVALAGVVGELYALNDFPAGISCNVGLISGGTRPNVIAAEAKAEVDVRFRTVTQAERIDATIRALRPVVAEAELEIEGSINRPPFEKNEATERLFGIAVEAARASGFEMGSGHVGGCSDGNLIAAMGVPVLDGLGVDGKGAHADHEQVVIADIHRRAAMLTRLVQALAG